MKHFIYIGRGGERIHQLVVCRHNVCYHQSSCIQKKNNYEIDNIVFLLSPQEINDDVLW